MLNLRAKVFSLVSILLNIILSPDANVFSLGTILTAHVHNPCAITFVPLCKQNKRNCVIIAILVTLLFLLTLLLIYLITNQ